MTAQQLWPQGAENPVRSELRRCFSLPLQQNVIRRGGKTRECGGKKKTGRYLVIQARCQQWLFSSVTREHFVVFSHGTARAIYMQSSSKSISAHAAGLRHGRSLSTVLMLSLRNFHPDRPTSCSARGPLGAPHCVSPRLTMEPEAAARVGPLSYFLWFLRASGTSCSFYSPFESNWACY